MPGRDERSADGVAVQHRQIPVQHHHIDVGGAQQRQGAGAVTGDVDAEPLVAQPVGQHLREIGLVLHDQQPHVSSLPFRPRSSRAPTPSVPAVRLGPG